MCVERVAVELEDVEKLKNNSATKRMLEEIDLGQRRHTGKVRSSVDVAAAFREADNAAGAVGQIAVSRSRSFLI